MTTLLWYLPIKPMKVTQPVFLCNNVLWVAQTVACSPTFISPNKCKSVKELDKQQLWIYIYSLSGVVQGQMLAHQTWWEGYFTHAALLQWHCFPSTPCQGLSWNFPPKSDHRNHPGSSPFFWHHYLAVKTSMKQCLTICPPCVFQLLQFEKLFIFHFVVFFDNCCRQAFWQNIFFLKFYLLLIYRASQ